MSDPALEALLGVQGLDSAMDRLRHRLKTLPERVELAELAARRAELGGRREQVAATRDEVAGREEALEDQLRSTEARANEVDRRLYGGEVSASRELQAMATDVTVLRARASALEDQAIEVLEEREPLDAAVAAMDAELAAFDAGASAAQARLEVALEAGGSELAGLESQRREAADAVGAELLAAYERLRGRLGGVGAARLVGSRCDGCHLTLPATELDRLRHQPAEAIVTCDQCGRILVRP